MERARLILNPEARAVTPSLTHVIQAALEARFKLEATTTVARGHGTEVALEAVDDGVEVVIAFGGDGLVNEVANGLAGTATRMGVIPGGTMNVFARNMGLPNDPLEATDLLLAHSAVTSCKRIELGKANDRYFLFTCGCGFDAESALRVEAHRRAKRKLGEPYFYAAALATFLRSYFDREPYLLCEGSFGKQEAVMAVALNAGPYAYLAGRPVMLSGQRTAAESLDLFILRRLRYAQLPTYAIGALFTGRFGSESSTHRNLKDFSVTGVEPFAVHVDGEPLELVDEVKIISASSYIDLIC